MPQGSILDPSLFTVHVNDMPLHVKQCNITFNADDTLLLFAHIDLNVIKQLLESDLANVIFWLKENKLHLTVLCIFIYSGSINHNKVLDFVSLDNYKSNSQSFQLHRSLDHYKTALDFVSVILEGLVVTRGPRTWSLGPLIENIGPHTW